MSTDQPGGVSYARTAGPADVGARVVVRRRLAEGGYGDVLGTLIGWGDEVVVRDRHGVEHAMAVADVVAAKRVPPPPERRPRGSAGR